MQSSHSLVADQFNDVNTLITEQLNSEVGLVENISHYLVDSGGKRVRPLVTLLSAAALGDAKHFKQIQLATAIEFLHTATLLHDDVVDMSTLRRGKPTANANWGNASSVLVGDFVYSKAFELLVAIGSLPVMDVLSHSTTKIAEGEVKQLMLIGDLSLSQADYFDVIRNKTAVLFSGCCRCAAIIADSNSETQNALALYGLHLGQAFQIFDDYLDYAGNADDLGKNVGDDLAEGKLTLPLIEALRLTGSTQDNRFLQRIIEEKDLTRIDAVVALCRESGALDHTLAVAHAEANAAKKSLAVLSQSIYRDALSDIADQAVHRKK
ncbi:MAG: octaprenyl diphosphate synthase [Cellvibrionales bacterium]|nr:octaprenyl diphosphate synthase [Cellvibrionales bacterium]